MSSEAMTAFFEHGKGSDAEWRMLALLANEADSDGVITISMEKIAERIGKTVNSIGQTKRRLKESGQLVILDEGGGRGNRATYWVCLPGLGGPKPPENEPRNGTNTPKDGGGKAADGSSTRRSNTSSSSARASGGSFAEELRDLDVPDEMQADGEAMLREKRKVGGKLVTPAEMAIAAAALAAFNREFEWEGRKGSEFGLGSALTSIVMRIREHPTWDAAKHVRLVSSAWRFRWWEGSERRRRPQPNVIWGDKAFAEVVQDAHEEATGEKKAERRYTRRKRG